MINEIMLLRMNNNLVKKAMQHVGYTTFSPTLYNETGIVLCRFVKREERIIDRLQRGIIFFLLLTGRHVQRRNYSHPKPFEPPFRSK